MQKAKFTFQKMNQDISPSKHKPEIYFEGRNIRVVTNDQQSTGSLSTDLGNEVCVSIPNGIVRIQTNGDLEVGDEGIFIPTEDQIITVPPTTRTQTLVYKNKDLNSLPSKVIGLEIIGYANIREDLYVFTTSETREPTSTSTGQIWKIDIKNCTANLVYYNYLGFSTKYPIRKALGKYENAKVQKIYWTDFNNYLRMINVADENVIDYHLTNIDNSPDVVLTQPVLSEIKSGGLFNSGKVQYAYALYDDYGPITKISPLSRLYPVSEMRRGNSLDETVGMSLRIRIPSPDKKFKNIRVYRIFYTSKDQEPLISLIDELSYTASDGNIYITDGGEREIENYSTEEFLFFGSDPVICKDIEIKDNHLFLANIKESYYDPDYDSRAYRFDSNGLCVINDRFGNQEASFNNTNYPTEKELDAINPSNKAETNLNYSETNNYYTGSENSLYNKYIYQSNGVVLGGEGPNVKYLFFTKDISPDDAPVAKSGIILNDEAQTNPLQAEFVGYKRDEIYRFAVVLYNNKWQPSFPLWIADIRMPDTKLKPITNGSSTSLETLSVSFGVSNLPSDCVAYQIVRLERREIDKTCVSQGMVNTMQYQNGTNAAPNIFDFVENDYKENYTPSWITRTFHSRGTGAHSRPRPFYNGLVIDGSSQNNRPEFLTNQSQSIRIASNMIQFYSPEIEHKATTFRVNNNDYFKVAFGAEEYDTQAKSWISTDNEDGFSESSAYNSDVFQNIINVHHGNTPPQNKPKTFMPTNSNSGNEKDDWRRRWVVTRRFKKTETLNTPVIKPERTFIYTERSHDGTGLFLRNANQYVIPGTSGNLTERFADKIYVNALETSIEDEGHNELISNNGRCITGIIKIGVGHSSTWSGKGFENAVNDGSYSSPDPVNAAFTYGSDVRNGKLCVVDYKRKVDNQYGGDSYEARQRNTYMPAGKVTPANFNFTTTIWGGDTYLGYYYLTRTTIFNPDLSDASSNKQSFRENLIFPVESSIPLDLRYDFQNIDITDRFILHEDVNKVNQVYEQESVLQNFTAKPFNFITIQEYDSRIKGSKGKTNGELVDSWLDYPVNDFIDVDNAYGSITALVENNDELFAFQPTGVSHVAINPRVQIVGNDNVSLELGTGSLLHDYKYITTTSGTSLQFGVKRAGKAIYYVDDRNYKIYQLLSQEKPLTDLGGMHKYLKDNVDWDSVRIDNPIQESGVTIGWNKELYDVFFTFVDRKYDLDDFVYARGNDGKPIYTLLSDTSFTVAFNELMQGFTSFYDFHPTLYIDNLNRFFSVNNDHTLWRHNKGAVNSYYDTVYPSEVTIIANPNPDYTKVFNTLHYESQVTLGGLDQPLNTLDTIKVWNDYQDTGEKLLTVGSLVKRKNREWRIHIPREDGTRNRIRSQWSFIKLGFVPEKATEKLVLHDLILDYTPTPASFPPR